MAPTMLQVSGPFLVHSHQIVVTPEFGRRQSPTGRAGRSTDDSVSVAGIVPHNGEGDASKLVGKRDGDELERLCIDQPLCPCTQGILVAFAMIEDRMSADDQQLS
jgi:hypothetical protein